MMSQFETYFDAKDVYFSAEPSLFEKKKKTVGQLENLVF